MTKVRVFVFAMSMFGIAFTTQAGVILSSPHQAVSDSSRNHFVVACVDAIRSQWHGAGLVLSQKAKLGAASDGARLMTVNGTVWQDGERASVSHQCALPTEGKQLALNIQVENQIASN